MRQNTPNEIAGRPGCLGAGGPVWYMVLAVSFLACSLNPVGAAGLAMRILTPRDIYSTPLGWALTAGSFVIAVMGFIATERVAYLERHRRALEIASLLACGAGVLAFALGFTLPAYIMWPIAAGLVLVGACGFRGTTSLPIPGMPRTGVINSPAVHAPGVTSRHEANIAHDAATSPAPGPGRTRRRRRRRKRPNRRPLP